MIYVPVKRQTIKSILEKSRLDGLFLCKGCQDGLPCTIMPLSTFKPFIKKKKRQKKKKAVFKVAVPLSLCAPPPSFYFNFSEKVPKPAHKELDAHDFERQLLSGLHIVKI